MKNTEIGFFSEEGLRAEVRGSAHGCFMGIITFSPAHTLKTIGRRKAFPILGSSTGRGRGRGGSQGGPEFAQGSLSLGSGRAGARAGCP